MNLRKVFNRMKTVIESNSTKFRTSGMLRDWRKKVPTARQRQRQKRQRQRQRQRQKRQIQITLNNTKAI